MPETVAQPTIARPAPRPAKFRTTALGWLILVESVFLLTTIWWPVRPFAAVLALALLMALIANGAIAAWQLRRIRVTTRLPQRVHANAEVAVLLSVASDLPTLPLRLEAADPTTRKEEMIARLPSLSAAPLRLAWEIRFPQRGLTMLPPIIARMDQPFGLVQVSRVVGEPTEVLVLPAIGFVRRELRNRLTKWLEQTNTGNEAGDDEISHLRPYRPGDPRHSIHWRASARNRTLLVTERNAPTCRRIALVLDTNLRGQSGKRLESLIATAATLIEHLSQRQWLVSLHGAFAPHGITGNRLHLIEALALIQSDNAADVREFIPARRSSLILSLNAPELPATQSALVLNLADCEKLVRLPRRRRE